MLRRNQILTCLQYSSPVDHEPQLVHRSGMKFLWLFAAVLCPFSLHAQWPEFRGPDANGTIAKSALPTEWSEEKTYRGKSIFTGLAGRLRLFLKGKSG